MSSVTACTKNWNTAQLSHNLFTEFSVRAFGIQVGDRCSKEHSHSWYNSKALRFLRRWPSYTSQPRTSLSVSQETPLPWMNLLKRKKTVGRQKNMQFADDIRLEEAVNQVEGTAVIQRATSGCCVLFCSPSTRHLKTGVSLQPPRWSRAGALAPWRETEEAAHVQPGEETAWGT